MSTEDIQKELDKRDARQKAVLLLTYGHQLTVMARDAYEFQGPGVARPRLLRDSNEILLEYFRRSESWKRNLRSAFPYQASLTGSLVMKKAEILSMQAHKPFPRQLKSATTHKSGKEEFLALPPHNTQRAGPHWAFPYP
jgi:hypothetical protein